MKTDIIMLSINETKKALYDRSYKDKLIIVVSNFGRNEPGCLIPLKNKYVLVSMYDLINIYED